MATCAIHKVYDQDCNYCSMVVDINTILTAETQPSIRFAGIFFPSGSSVN